MIITNVTKQLINGCSCVSWLITELNVTPFARPALWFLTFLFIYSTFFLDKSCWHKKKALSSFESQYIGIRPFGKEKRGNAKLVGLFFEEVGQENYLCPFVPRIVVPSSVIRDIIGKVCKLLLAKCANKPDLFLGPEIRVFRRLCRMWALILFNVCPSVDFLISNP